MKTVTIPTCANPFVVIVNGIKYTYPAGATVEVPDDVAAVIEQHDEAHSKHAPAPVVPPYSGDDILAAAKAYTDKKVAEGGGSGGGGESVSWNDLTDKPFGNIPITTDTITWNGKSDIVVGDMLYYVSDFAPTAEQLEGCSVVLTVDDNDETVMVAAESIIPAAENLLMVMLSETAFFIVTSADNVSADGLELPKKGVYFTKTIKSATFLAQFETTEIVKIDPKYVPTELPELNGWSSNWRLGVVDGKWGIVEKDIILLCHYRVIINNIESEEDITSMVLEYSAVSKMGAEPLTFEELFKFGSPISCSPNGSWRGLYWDYNPSMNALSIIYTSNAAGAVDIRYAPSVSLANADINVLIVDKKSLY